MEEFFFTHRIFIFIEHMYDSVICHAENDLDAGLHVLEYGISGFLYDVIIL